MNSFKGMAVVLAAALSASAVFSQEAQPSQGGTVIVAYFSQSADRNAAQMARCIQAETGGTLFEIAPQTPYPLPYEDVAPIARREKNSNARPKLLKNLDAKQISDCGTLFVGYPIWSYDAPMIVYSFLESHDLKGKKVILFATSRGSTINEARKMREITGADVQRGLCLSFFSAGQKSQDEVKRWIRTLGLSQQ